MNNLNSSCSSNDTAGSSGATNDIYYCTTYLYNNPNTTLTHRYRYDCSNSHLITVNPNQTTPKDYTSENRPALSTVVSDRDNPELLQQRSQQRRGRKEQKTCDGR